MVATTTRSEFDLASPRLRILECSQCDEPVSGEHAGGRRLSVTCGYCGFTDERELTTTHDAAPAEVPFRGKAARSARKTRVDISGTPEGVTARARIPELRRAYLEAKKAAPAATTEDEEARLALEFRLLHVAAVLAAHQTHARDFVHARAVLETVLEHVTLPVYRALVLTRLARLATLSNGPELAEQWLDACPKGLRVAEVTSDRRVAEAFVARARGDARGVLEVLGERDTASELVGPSRWVGVALRVDAHEQLGDRRLARRVWMDSGRGHRRELDGAAAMFGLAPAVRAAVLRRGLVALAILGAAAVAVVRVATSIGSDDPVLPWLGLFAAAVAGAIILKNT